MQPLNIRKCDDIPGEGVVEMAPAPCLNVMHIGRVYHPFKQLVPG